MAFLTIGAQNLDVQLAGAKRAPNILVGKRSRAFAGNLRSSVRRELRAWDFNTAPMLTADVATLRATIANDAFTNCSGVFLGGVVSCSVEITTEDFIPDGISLTTYQSILGLHLEEVG